MTTSVESVAFNSMGPVRLVNFPAMIVHFVRLSSGFIEIPRGKFDNRSLLVIGKCGHSFHMVYIRLKFGC